jgi:hypothetical protein
MKVRRPLRGQYQGTSLENCLRCIHQRRFSALLQGLEKRLLCVAQAEVILLVHVTGAEINLCGLPDDMILMSGFGYKNADVME